MLWLWHITSHHITAGETATCWWDLNYWCVAQWEIVQCQCVYTCYTVLQPVSSSPPPPPLTAGSVAVLHNIPHQQPQPPAPSPKPSPRPMVSSVLLLNTDPVWGWRDQVTVATSDVNTTELSQSSLDIQLDLKCHLAFNNYPQLRHNSQTSITSIINFVKITTNHLVDPNTEMLDSFKQFYLRAKQYRLWSISTKFKRIHPSFLPSFLRISNKVQIRIELVASNTIRNRIISLKIFFKTKNIVDSMLVFATYWSKNKFDIKG